MPTNTTSDELSALTRFYNKVSNYDPELQKVIKTIGLLTGENLKTHILDVGCGYGRFLKPLHQLGYTVTGIDINQTIVHANVKSKLHCVASEQFLEHKNKNPGLYNIILMSHLVQHLNPEAALKLIDFYLDHLNPGGYLVICTPLLTPYFFDDFDHVRPYQPTGFLMVFGETVAQVQFQARNKLKLHSLWYRRGIFRFHHTSAKYIHSQATRFIFYLEFISTLLYRLSFGRIGMKDAWMGVFQKL